MRGVGDWLGLDFLPPIEQEDDLMDAVGGGEQRPGWIQMGRKYVMAKGSTHPLHVLLLRWVLFDDDDLSFKKDEDILALSGGGDWHM